MPLPGAENLVQFTFLYRTKRRRQGVLEFGGLDWGSGPCGAAPSHHGMLCLVRGARFFVCRRPQEERGLSSCSVVGRMRWVLLTYFLQECPFLSRRISSAGTATAVIHHWELTSCGRISNARRATSTTTTQSKAGILYVEDLAVKLWSSLYRAIKTRLATTSAVAATRM